MPRDRLVVVSYPADEDYARINAEVLQGDANVAFLRQVPESDRPALLARAEALIGWNLRGSCQPERWSRRPDSASCSCCRPAPTASTSAPFPSG